MTLATPPFGANSLGVMSGLSLGACLPNLNFVPLVILELLAFSAQKLRGHVTLATPTFRKKFSGVMSGLSLGARCQI